MRTFLTQELRSSPWACREGRVKDYVAVLGPARRAGSFCTGIAAEETKEVEPPPFEGPPPPSGEGGAPGESI